MIKVIFFLLTFLSLNFSHAEENEKNCAEVLNSSLITPTDDFWMYLKDLIDEQVIKSDDLNKFYHHLSQGKLINPIQHQLGPNGPLFTSATDFAHYNQVQKFIRQYDQDQKYLDLNILFLNVGRQLGYKEEVLRQKIFVSSHINLKMIADLIYERPYLLLNLMPKIEAKLVAKSKKTVELLANELIALGGSPQLVNESYKLLSYTKDKFPFSFFNELYQSEKVSYEVATLFLDDDHSQEFANFVMDLLFYSQYTYKKMDLVSRVKYLDRPDLLKYIRELVLTEKTYFSSRVFLAKLAEIDTAENRQFFWDVILKHKNIQHEVRSQAMRKIIDWGEGDKLFEKSFLNEIKKNNLSSGYYEVLYFKVLSSLAGRSDDYSLNLIKKAYKNLGSDIGRSSFIYALKGRKDEDSKKFILSFSSNDEKLQMIQGRDEDWCLDLIESSYDKVSIINYEFVVNALEGMSSLRSRNLLEKILSDYDNKKFYFLQSGDISKTSIVVAIASRPIADIVYFLKKYKDSTDYGLLMELFNSILRKNDSAAIEIAKQYLQSTDTVKQNMAFDYLKTISEELLYPILREVLNSPSEIYSTIFRKKCLESLIGAIDQESLKLFEKYLKGDDRNLTYAAIEPYLFFYLYHRDELNDHSTEWDMSLVMRILGK